MAFTCGDAADPAEGTKAAMASVAARWLELDAEAARLEAALEELVTRVAAPEFLARTGAGCLSVSALIAAAGDNPGRIRSEAAYAALCGVSPVDCSSGKQQRHRLNRGGDRQANSALWRIATTRLQHDPRTQDYAARRTAAGKTRKEIIRELKRYIAREAYRELIRPGFATATVPPSRQAAYSTLTCNNSHPAADHAHAGHAACPEIGPSAQPAQISRCQRLANDLT